MKEVIIYSNKIVDTELKTSLALRGISTINNRIFNFNNIIDYSLSKTGLIIDKKIISNDDIPYIFINILKGKIKLFDNFSFIDYKNLSTTINNYRMISLDDSDLEARLNKSEFKEKTNAILKSYEIYKEYLKDNNLTDYINISKELINKKLKTFDSINILKRNDYTLVEIELLKSLSNNINYIELNDLFNIKENNKLKIKSFTNYYGTSNETRGIIDNILNNNLKLDSISIVVSNNTYIKELFDLSIKYNIPMTFENGISIIYSNAYKLLKALDIYEGDSFFSKSQLLSIFNSNYFNKELFFSGYDKCIVDTVIDIISDIKVTFDKVSNDKLYNDFINSKVAHENIEARYNHLIGIELTLNEFKDNVFNLLLNSLNIFSNGIKYIIENYTVVRDSLESIDTDGLNNILETLDNIIKFNINDYKDIKDIYKEIEGLRINKSLFKPGMIHVSNLSSAINTYRCNLFILGMSSEYFPAQAKENYLALDSELSNFDTGLDSFGSNNISINSINDLYEYIKLNSNIKNNIYISYSTYLVSDVKPTNISSFIYRLMNESNNKDEIEVVEYFNDSLSNIKPIYDNYYKEGLNIKSYELDITESYDNYLSCLNKVYSPSKLLDLDCKLKFFIKDILNLNIEKEEDALESLGARELGTIVHKVFENFKLNKNVLLDDLIIEAHSLYNDYLKTKVPVIKSLKDNDLKTIDNIIKNGYKELININIIETEKELSGSYTYFDEINNTKYTLKLKGIADVIIKNDNNTYTVLDYKTGKTVRHNNDDYESCIQGIIYCYLLDNYSFNDLDLRGKIDSCKFFYVRNGLMISSKYDKALAEEFLNSIIKRIVFDKFDMNKKGNKSCNYCDFLLICENLRKINKTNNNTIEEESSNE